MGRTGRKVGYFTWGSQPKRGQHIGGIGEAHDYYLEGMKLAGPFSSLASCLLWNGYRY